MSYHVLTQTVASAPGQWKAEFSPTPGFVAREIYVGYAAGDISEDPGAWSTVMLAASDLRAIRTVHEVLYGSSLTYYARGQNESGRDCLVFKGHVDMATRGVQVSGLWPLDLIAARCFVSIAGELAE